MITKNRNQRESFKYKPINQKIYLRPRSVERMSPQEKINDKNNIPYIPCNTSNEYNSKSDCKKNKVIYLEGNGPQTILFAIERIWLYIVKYNGYFYKKTGEYYFYQDNAGDAHFITASQFETMKGLAGQEGTHDVNFGKSYTYNKDYTTYATASIETSSKGRYSSIQFYDDEETPARKI